MAASRRSFVKNGVPRALAAVLVFLSFQSSLKAESADMILDRAHDLLGQPYRGGGISPGGFDCSGFVTYLYRPTLPGLPRMSQDMARIGEPVESGRWQRGDLLFYTTGADPARINHVAIWYGNGTIIHSISDGPETGVVLTPADARYWRTRYAGARRVLPDTGHGTQVQPSLSPAPGTSGPAASAPPGPETTLPAPSGTSPWDSFDGILRGDYETWRKTDDDAFEQYRSENG